MALRLVFMATPEFSAPTLHTLVEKGKHEIIAVYTRPPQPAGRRGLELKKTPIHELAEKFSIPVLTPKSLKGETEQVKFAALGADAAIVIAYGLILPQAVLNAVPLGCWNGHASLLPRWRGAAPIERAIMAGDEKSGVCIMKMDAGLDTGPVALSGEMEIGADMTAAQLHDELSHITADLMLEALDRLEEGKLETVAQSDHGVTYAEKISKSEARIDWSRSSREVHNLIRGLSPFPGSWSEIEIDGKKERIKFLGSQLADSKADNKTGDDTDNKPGMLLDDQLTIGCGKGAVLITRLQRAGKKPQSADEFLRGLPLVKSMEFI